jgi:hypothetical protein
VRLALPPRGAALARQFALLLAWPAVSAAFLIFVAVYSVPTFDVTTNVVGHGGIAIGVVPWVC